MIQADAPLWETTSVHNLSRYGLKGVLQVGPGFVERS
jgi:hypothetical protein